ncbi:MAG: DUF1320 domain-containing protein [Rhodobiaceae bacterium]|nr:DUF1320 domain-containing protein [Rhodobiaceae bacterium]MCC0054334.1 DUF1320 domain-containing protein [Rhodobiaceae bacterium]
MSYATLADIEAVYGSGEIADVLDVPRDEALTGEHQAKVARALEAVSSEIDTALAQRYPVPLDPVPEAVRGWAIDLALHRLSLQSTLTKEELSKRAEMIARKLSELARGIGGLPGYEGTGSGEGGDVTIGGGDVLVSARPGRYPKDGELL